MAQHGRSSDLAPAQQARVTLLDKKSDNGPELLARVHCRAKPQMFDKCVEVAVAVEQFVAVKDAVRGNHRVNGFAHRNAEPAQLTKVFCCLNRDLTPAQIKNN